MHRKVLTPLQLSILEGFFGRSGGEPGFYLTGGTALAAFYYQHRLSEDLDLFAPSIQDQESAGVLSGARAILESLADEKGYDLDAGQSSHRHLLQWVSGETPRERIKLDLVCEPWPNLGELITHGLIRVDSLDDLVANKLGALYSRPEEIKDFVDLYYLLHPDQGHYTLDGALALADRKQVGLDRVVLASQMSLVDGAIQHLPALKLLKPLDADDLRQFFHDLAEELVMRYRPEG